MKKKHRKFDKSAKNTLKIWIVIVIIILLLVVVWTRFVEADETNTYTVVGIIQKPQKKNSTGLTWVRFKINGKPMYAETQGDNTLFDMLQELSQNKTKVLITYPRYSAKNLELLLMEMDSQKAMVIVDAESGVVYYDDTNEHNSWVKVGRILLTIILSLQLLLFLSMQVFSLYVDITCRMSSKKSKARRKRRPSNDLK